ncbi:MAG TPA: hypothetical protein VNM72_01655 [Blastocatellia bacterium]|nr:hypothetical protein [Blastocatellia bacterium]
MKKSLVCLVALAMLVGAVVAQDKTPNFSGTWVLDRSQSDPPGGFGAGRGGGGQMANAEVLLIIEHQEPTLKIKRIIRTEQGERTQELVYTTDGKENKNPGMRGAEVKSKSKWEKGKLVTKASQTIETPQGTVDLEITEIRSLSEDGKTLTVEITTVTPMGERKRKEVYVKKEG